ncbi:sodium:dicarboxylate symporter [Candidatus Epulonipiscium fishelsonii]|uniref:Sodium:dicarboxylate symporter n=1 Tax=Candidatus Epulonipiscium fishelsonii TaxID=77094 RepID=A0ACC8XDB8_9FIRM|nr:sodium:dicarboxylate symporter [Epulopiscium sp. SCG-B11WGA-EpuloA1]
MKKYSLSTQIFISLISGMLLGLLCHYFVPAGYFKEEVLAGGVFYLVGNVFMRGMQMLVVPLVFCSLVCGTMSIGDTATLGKVGIKTLGFYLVTTAVAIAIALGLASVVNPGIGLDMSTVKIAETTIAENKGVVETLLDIVPKNPVQSLAEGSMLQIIFFAVLLGFILASQGDEVRHIANNFNQWNTIMMSMTMVVMKVAPIGVFCLVAKTFTEIGLGGFLPMIKYMLCVFGALAIHGLIIYMLMLKVFTGRSPSIFLKKMVPVMAFAFSTASSNATLPLTIETLNKKMGVSKKIASFTLPLGATINMDGTAIMQGVAVVFAAQAFNISLTPMDYITVIFTATMASIGTAAVPGVGLITLSMVFASVGLPIEAIGIIMGIDRILDMTRTAVNVTGDAVCTVIIAHKDNSIKDEVFNAE